MSYQNINQYNFRRWGLLPVNEITDICLASDEKTYDQEVVFSPLLIGEDDGNRMPFKFDFNSSATTFCQRSVCKHHPSNFLRDFHSFKSPLFQQSDHQQVLKRVLVSQHRLLE